MSENSSREMSLAVAGVKWSHMNKIFPFKLFERFQRENMRDKNDCKSNERSQATAKKFLRRKLCIEVVQPTIEEI